MMYDEIFLGCWGLFCQAEYGIRDLVRSRGLGDVYKRQAERVGFEPTCPFEARRFRGAPVTTTSVPLRSLLAVSYTHLTLPTSDLV